MTGIVNMHTGALVNYDELNQFARQVKKYLRGVISDDDFIATRLQQGVYGQRQEGQYMVRVKIPGGFLTLDQLSCLGRLIRQFSAIDFANITTRQDIQLHFIDIKDVPKVLLALADVGLTSREACGNTVRNITACPYAGSCEKERVDVQSLVGKIASHCLRHPVMQHLPRKFKMSVSGCEQDCAVSMIQDVGVIATERSGDIGYRVKVAGGLGHKPRESFVLEEFVTEEDLLLVIESIIALHNQYSDRSKRAKSRLKFLVDKFGRETFKNKYREALEISRKRYALKAEQPVQFITRNHIKDRINNKIHESLEIGLSKGDISCNDIDQLVDILRLFQGVSFQTLQNQNLLIKNIAPEIRENLAELLLKSDFIVNETKPKSVACPGSWTCRLGITSSRSLLDVLDKGGAKMKIHISGCHNSCAQPQLADIGLHGEAKRLFGYLVPYYQLHLGGSRVGESSLAMKGPEVPAVRVKVAVARIQTSYRVDSVKDETFQQWVNRKKLPFFTELLEDITFVTRDDLSSLLRDVDQPWEFEVLQLGGGECAGVKVETLSSKLAELAYEQNYMHVFAQQGKFSLALECAERIILLAIDTLFIKNKIKESVTLSNVYEKYTEYFLADGQKAKVPLNLLDRLDVIEGGSNANEFKGFIISLEEWLIDLKLEQNNRQGDQAAAAVDAVIDLTDEAGPVQFLKAKQALSAINGGRVLEFILSNNKDYQRVTDGLRKIGYIVMSKHQSSATCRVHVFKPLSMPERVSVRERSLRAEQVG